MRRTIIRAFAALLLALPLASAGPRAASAACVYLGPNCLEDRSGDGVLVNGTGMRIGDAVSANAMAAQNMNSRVQVGRLTTAAGDSTSSFGTINNPPSAPFLNSSYNVGSAAQSYLGWLQIVTGQAMTVDYTQGFPGSPGGIAKLYIISGGSCPTNQPLTISFGAPNQAPSNQAGPVTVQVNAQGQAVGYNGAVAGTLGNWVPLPLAVQGSGYTSVPNASLSGTASCTTPPVFGYALTGYGDYGVPGSTTANTIEVIRNEICPNSATDVVLVQDGTNDFTAGVPVATTIANKTTEVQMLQACGKQPIVSGITSRGQGTGGWTAAMDKQRLRVNAAMQAFAYTPRANSAGRFSPPIYVDIDQFDTDPTSAAGNPLSIATSDQLHQSPSRTFTGALAIANATRHLWSPVVNFGNSQGDTYDATNNPTGNLIGTTGLMLAGGGNAGSLGGTVAQNWQIQTSGTGTLSGSASLETTRTDGLPGSRQVITYSNTGGSATEKLTFAEYVSPVANLNLGVDKIYMTYEDDVSNMSQVQYIGGQLLENAPSGGSQQTATCVNSGTVGAAYPLPSSAQIAKFDAAKILPDFGLSASGSFKMKCRTPSMQTQAGGSGYSISIITQGSSATGTFSITHKIGNVKLWKVAQ